MLKMIIEIRFFHAIESIHVGILNNSNVLENLLYVTNKLIFFFFLRCVSEETI